ncbi:PilN domain-containing protein [Aestuariirhabdus sp. LZHN29]|uniref:PilN domain-containing protein n=1 Tax=Aestuariirhabdus sp. LZHN29 TaxID=3417462 RepID=UPI003CE8D63E
MQLQQVNFHHSAKLREHARFGGLRLAQSCVLLALVLAAYAGMEYRSVHKLQDAVTRQQEGVEQLTQSRNQAVAELLKLKNDRTSAAEVARLEADLGAKQRLAFHLSQALEVKGEGFTALMGGLSNNHQGGVWLTGFDFLSGGQRLSLQGETRKPELIPHYLQALQKAPVFYGKGFELFSMTRDEERTKLLVFELKAKREVTP